MKVQNFLLATTLFCLQTGFSQLAETKLTASDGSTSDLFGYSVSISGNYAIISAPYDNYSNLFIGSAYIFKREGSLWIEQVKLVDSTSSNFGNSVSISGDYAIVSALYDYSIQNRGAVHIYRRVGESWIQEAEISPPDVTGNDSFGESTSLSGDYAIVGAFRDSDLGLNSGSAYVFKREGTTWMQQAKLTASDGSANDNFGGSVSLSGDYTLIGARGDDDFRGSVYVFMRSGEDWFEQTKLVAGDRSRDGFGVSVSLDGDYAIIGADYDTVDGIVSGSAYVFKREGEQWDEQAKLSGGPGSGEFDQFGHSVSISGDHAVVGVVGDDRSGFNAGSSYFYRRDQSSWIEVENFTASDVEPEDAFGGSVFIDGNYIIIGSAGRDDRGYSSGAAYVYDFAASIAPFDVCYGSTGSAEPTNPGALITIDPLTGAGTLVGPTGIIGEDGPAVRALAIKSTGEMYAMSNTASSDLYSVNASNGAGTFVANTGLLRPGDIVFDANDVLYAVDETNILYTVDEVTGTRTVVGATGVTLGGLAYDPTDGTMYGSGTNDDIYTIDVETGAATLLGTTGLGGNIPDIHFDQTGNLYGTKRGTGDVYDFISIDKTTGAGTVIGSTGFVAVVGLATRLSPPLAIWESDESWEIPVTTSLVDNYPNPFNPSTTISYALSEHAQVTLKVYNMLGQVVATLVDESQTAGYKSVVWNGRNDSGAALGSGMYLYRMTAGKFVTTKKMLLLK